MSNPLYQSMSSNQNGFRQALNHLKRTFNGDPQQKVQEMLNSGQVTQAQYNSAVQKMQELKKML